MALSTAASTKKPVLVLVEGLVGGLSGTSLAKAKWKMFVLVKTTTSNLGGGNSNMFYFHPEKWGRFSFECYRTL